jgi:hypothetical protein
VCVGEVRIPGLEAVVVVVHGYIGGVGLSRSCGGMFVGSWSDHGGFQGREGRSVKPVLPASNKEG